MTHNKLHQPLMPLLPLLSPHSNSLINRLRQLHCIRRMEINSRLVHKCGRAGEFGEDEHAVTLGLAGDVLEGDEVHAVAGGGEEAGICNGVHGCEFVEGDGAMHV